MGNHSCIKLLTRKEYHPIWSIMASTGVSMDGVIELLNEGKRDLLMSAIPDAVANFSKCCEMLVALKGEMAEECAEAYFYYGRALLELSRVESGVLGNALDGVDMDADASRTKISPTKGEKVDYVDGMPIVEDVEGLPSEKKAEIEEKVADALEENFDKHEMLAKAHNADNTEEMTDDDSAEDKMETDAENIDEKSEEPGNLEQAWQMFDLAKVIYAKAKNEVKECESLIHLAEVSLENSNFKQAVEDLQTCLAKRLKTLPADSRSIAETHYQLGVAQAHCEDFVNAEKSLKAAIAVLDTRVENLKKMEVSENIKKELAELEILCHDIKERMNDHKDMQKGVYKQDKDFVSVFKSADDGIVATEIGVKTTAGAIA